MFIPNYSLSSSEVIIPAADVFEKITCPGEEEMSFNCLVAGLNGAVIVGSRDSSSVEFAPHIDPSNMVLFGVEHDGLSAARERMRNTGYDDYFCPPLREVLDAVRSGIVGPETDYRPLIDQIVWRNDHYLVGHDFNDYIRAQDSVDQLFADKKKWGKTMAHSTIGMTHFFSDRTVNQYIKNVWDVQSAVIKEPTIDY